MIPVICLRKKTPQQLGFYQNKIWTGPAGDLTVNRIANSTHTDINQDEMKILGMFSSIVDNR